MAEHLVLGFGGLLRQLRTRAGLTQEELAEAAGLSPRSVSDLERGINRTARKDTAGLLADALGMAEPARELFVAAALGHAPAAEVLAALQGQAAPGSGPVWAGCPYLGLVPFEERDARVFYGRGELTDQLVHKMAGRLDGTGILLVAGESGTGKSSLLRAGLMPRLAAGALGPGSERWPRRVIRPADSPLRELAIQLADVADADPPSVYRSLSAAPGEAPTLVELAVRTATGRGARARSRVPADAAAAPPRLVLVVDQFEELFTAGGHAEADRAEREAFIAALHAAATGLADPHKLPPALVVAAVRADFLGRLIAYPPLKAALDAGLFTVGPMSEAELRLAMTGPAAEAGLAIEPALVEAVIAELREGAGAGLGSGVLPLISQAMAATWQLREGSELTLRSYRRAGGVANVVNRSAQAAYDTLTNSQKDAVRLVFTQLTVITPDGQFARRQCSRIDLHSAGEQIGDIDADIDAVIDVFSAHRLLVLGKDSVEIAHDVLLQAWKQLRDWLGDDQHDRALNSQVTTDAQAWESNRRDSSYLYRPGRLATMDAAVTRWQNASARYPPLSATSKAFLDAAHHAARRSTRRRRSAFAILALLTGLAVAASVVAWYQRAAAVRQRDQAIFNQVIAEALQSAADDPTLAAQLTLAAYRIQPGQDAASRLLNTENTPLYALVTAGTGRPYSPVFWPFSVAFSPYGVAFSPSRHMLASTGADAAVRLWDVADPARPRLFGSILTGGGGVIDSVAFSPDGRTLGCGSVDGTVRLYDVADPARPRLFGSILTGGGGVIDSVAFSPDGRTLASGGLDGTIGIWNVADPAHVQSRGQSVPSGRFRAVSVAFSPGGRTLAGGSLNGTIRMWDFSDRAHPRLLSPIPTSGTAAIYAVAFSRDGLTLAGGSNDGTIRLWDVSDPARPRPAGILASGAAAINSVAFSPDGRTLASGSSDGIIRLWDAANPAQPHRLGEPLTGYTGAIVAVAFGPGGRTLVSATGNGTIRLWNLPQTVMTGSTAAINSVAFSRNGHTLAGGSNDGTIRLWDAANPTRPRPLGRIPASGTTAIDSVAFSRDGRTLAEGSHDGTVRLWDIGNPARPRSLDPSLTGAGGVPAGSVAVSPDGHTLASGGDYGGTPRLWDVTNPAHPRPLGQPLAGVPATTSVAFGPHGHMLATGDSDGSIHLWNVTDRMRPRPFGPALTSGTAAITSVAFSADGYVLASGNSNGTVHLWNVANPARPRSLGPILTSRTAVIKSVAFSRYGHMLASGDSDGTVQLWNVANPARPRSLGPPLTVSTVPVDGVAFRPDGHTLATSSDDGTIRLWNLNVQYAIQRICSAAGDLTPTQWNQYIPQLPYQPSCVH